MQNTICAASILVTFNGETKPASRWAKERGLKWQTVKMRRMRGGSWEEALRPTLKRSSWMSRWTI